MYRVRLNAAAIWDAIARQNMSQNDLAVKLGISSGYMSQLVCGTRCPSARLRRKMLECLNPLNFDDLFVIEGRHDGCQR